MVNECIKRFFTFWMIKEINIFKIMYIFNPLDQQNIIYRIGNIQHWRENGYINSLWEYYLGMPFQKAI